MNILLDTQIIIWATGNPTRLRPETRVLLLSPDNRLFLSAVSLWEMQIKSMKGALSIPAAFDSELEALGIEPLPVTWAHARAIRHLAPIHKDPFDRMLVAQAQTEGLQLLSSDKEILRYPVATIPA